MANGTAKLKARAKRLWDNYKLTVAQWEQISEYQHGVCYICGRVERVSGRSLATDHSHLDGLIRGLLCSQCNPWIGKIENAFVRLGLKNAGLDFVTCVARVAEYINNPPATRALGAATYGYAGRTGTKKHRKLLKKMAKHSPPETASTRQR